MALVKNAAARIPEVGKVKIGMKEEEERTSRNGTKWRAPLKLDHAIVTTNERDARGDFKVDLELMKRLAPEGTPQSKFVKGAPALTEIPIALYSDDIADVIDQRYAWYPGKSKGASCDGETLTCFVDKAGNPLRKPVTKPCNGEHEGEGWKLHTRFNFAIAAGEARWGGVYSFRTTSDISAQQLVGSLERIKMLTYGVLQGLPLTLVFRPMQVAPEGKPSTVWVAHVELRGRDTQDVQRLALSTMESRTKFAVQIEAARSEARKLLRAPVVDDTPEETAEIVEEFHPEVIEAKAVVPPALAAVAPDAATAPPAPVTVAPSVADALVARAEALSAHGPELTQLHADITAAAKAGSIAGDEAKRVSKAYADATARANAVKPEAREVTPPPKPRKTPPPPPKRPDVVVQPTPAYAPLDAEPPTPPPAKPAAAAVDIPF